MGFYQRPFDSLCPVVCIDEMNRQLVEETRIPCEAGQPEKWILNMYVKGLWMFL